MNLAIAGHSNSSQSNLLKHYCWKLAQNNVQKVGVGVNRAYDRIGSLLSAWSVDWLEVLALWVPWQDFLCMKSPVESWSKVQHKCSLAFIQLGAEGIIIAAAQMATQSAHLVIAHKVSQHYDHPVIQQSFNWRLTLYHFIFIAGPWGKEQIASCRTPAAFKQLLCCHWYPNACQLIVMMITRRAINAG